MKYIRHSQYYHRQRRNNWSSPALVRYSKYPGFVPSSTNAISLKAIWHLGRHVFFFYHGYPYGLCGLGHPHQHGLNGHPSASLYRSYFSTFNRRNRSSSCRGLKILPRSLLSNVVNSSQFFVLRTHVTEKYMGWHDSCLVQ